MKPKTKAMKRKALNNVMKALENALIKGRVATERERSVLMIGSQAMQTNRMELASTVT